MAKEVKADTAATIREAQADDLEAIWPLVQAFRDEHGEMLGAGIRHTREQAIEEARSNLESDDAGYILAFDSEQRVVGFRRWELHDGFYFTRELYVVPDMRRKGIARQLIRFFEQWLLDKKQDIACISTVPANRRMIELARSEGYDILNMVELRKDLVRSDRKRTEVDALGLKWTISQA